MANIDLSKFFSVFVVLVLIVGVALPVISSVSTTTEETQTIHSFGFNSLDAYTEVLSTPVVGDVSPEYQSEYGTFDSSTMTFTPDPSGSWIKIPSPILVSGTYYLTDSTKYYTMNTSDTLTEFTVPSTTGVNADLVLSFVADPDSDDGYTMTATSTDDDLYIIMPKDATFTKTTPGTTGYLLNDVSNTKAYYTKDVEWSGYSGIRVHITHNSQTFEWEPMVAPSVRYPVTVDFDAHKTTGGTDATYDGVLRVIIYQTNSPNSNPSMIVLLHNKTTNELDWAYYSGTGSTFTKNSSTDGDFYVDLFNNSRTEWYLLTETTTPTSSTTPDPDLYAYQAPVSSVPYASMNLAADSTGFATYTMDNVSSVGTFLPAVPGRVGTDGVINGWTNMYYQSDITPLSGYDGVYTVAKTNTGIIAPVWAAYTSSPTITTVTHTNLTAQSDTFTFTPDASGTMLKIDSTILDERTYYIQDEATYYGIDSNSDLVAFAAPTDTGLAAPTLTWTLNTTYQDLYEITTSAPGTAYVIIPKSYSDGINDTTPLTQTWTPIRGNVANNAFTPNESGAYVQLFSANLEHSTYNIGDNRTYYVDNDGTLASFVTPQTPSQDATINLAVDSEESHVYDLTGSTTGDSVTVLIPYEVTYTTTETVTVEAVPLVGVLMVMLIVVGIVVAASLVIDRRGA